MKKVLLALLVLLSFSLSAFAAVNLNTATQAELEGLNGIGPAKAKAIIDYRQKNGGFKSVDDLGKVTGVGPSILKKVRNDVSVGGKPVAAPAAVKAANGPVAKAPAVVAPAANVKDVKAKAK